MTDTPNTEKRLAFALDLCDYMLHVSKLQRFVKNLPKDRYYKRLFKEIKQQTRYFTLPDGLLGALYHYAKFENDSHNWDVLSVIYMALLRRGLKTNELSTLISKLSVIQDIEQASEPNSTKTLIRLLQDVEDVSGELWVSFVELIDDEFGKDTLNWVASQVTTKDKYNDVEFLV